MTEKQIRLHNLQQRIKSCRKQNLNELQKEKKTEVDGPKKQNSFKNKKRLREEEKDLKISAETSEYIQKIKEKKRQNIEFQNQLDWSNFSPESLYHSHEKNNSVPTTPQEYEEIKQKEGEDFYNKNNLEYGANDQVNEKFKSRLVKDITKKNEKKKKFSRRRMFFEDEDVTYINPGNRKFNQKLSRNYDKYTTEIQQNLERGTAL
jgi:pre-mRNA-splicing factor SYF2